MATEMASLNAPSSAGHEAEQWHVELEQDYALGLRKMREGKMDEAVEMLGNVCDALEECDLDLLGASQSRRLQVLLQLAARNYTLALYALSDEHLASLDDVQEALELNVEDEYVWLQTALFFQRDSHGLRNPAMALHAAMHCLTLIKQKRAIHVGSADGPFARVCLEQCISILSRQGWTREKVENVLSDFTLQRQDSNALWESALDDVTNVDVSAQNASLPIRRIVLRKFSLVEIAEKLATWIKTIASGSQFEMFDQIEWQEESVDDESMQNEDGTNEDVIMVDRDPIPSSNGQLEAASMRISKRMREKQNLSTQDRFRCEIRANATCEAIDDILLKGAHHDARLMLDHDHFWRSIAFSTWKDALSMDQTEEQRMEAITPEKHIEGPVGYYFYDPSVAMEFTQQRENKSFLHYGISLMTWLFFPRELSSLNPWLMKWPEEIVEHCRGIYSHVGEVYRFHIRDSDFLNCQDSFFKLNTCINMCEFLLDCIISSNVIADVDQSQQEFWINEFDAWMSFVNLMADASDEELALRKLNLRVQRLLLSDDQVEARELLETYYADRDDANEQVSIVLPNCVFHSVVSFASMMRTLNTLRDKDLLQDISARLQAGDDSYIVSKVCQATPALSMEWLDICAITCKAYARLGDLDGLEESCYRWLDTLFRLTVDATTDLAGKEILSMSLECMETLSMLESLRPLSKKALPLIAAFSHMAVFVINFQEGPRVGLWVDRNKELYQFVIQAFTLLLSVAERELDDGIVSMYSAFHELLSDRALCSYMDAKFLRKSISILENRESSTELLQCYYCLYGIPIRGSADVDPIDHSTELDEITETVTRKLLPRLCSDVRRKLERGILVDQNSKKALEVLAEQDEMDAEKDHFMAVRRSCLEVWLQRDLTPKDLVFCSNMKMSYLPSDWFSRPSAQCDAFYLKGWIAEGSILSRLKLGTFVLDEDYMNAEESLLTHTLLRPKHADGWARLGNANVLIAEHLLTNSASMIRDANDDIYRHLKRAFRAYSVALECYSSYHHDNYGKIQFNAFDLLYHLGRVALMIASPPLSSFIPLVDMSPSEASLGALGRRDLLQFACNMFEKSRSGTRYSWESLIHHIHALDELEAAPDAMMPILEALMKGPFETEDKELYSRSLVAGHAMKYLNESELLNLNRVVKLITDAETDSTSRIALVEAILRALQAIHQRSRYQHEAAYSLSWLLHHVYKRPDLAKEVLSTIVTFKSQGRSLVAIWKTDYDLAGRYYVSSEKYVRFAVEVLSESRDVERLVAFIRRIRRAEETIINYKDVWTDALARLIDMIFPACNSVRRIPWDTALIVPFLTTYVQLSVHVPEEVRGVYQSLCQLVEFRSSLATLKWAEALDERIADCFLVLLNKAVSTLPTGAVGIPASASHVVKDKELVVKACALVNATKM